MCVSPSTYFQACSILYIIYQIYPFDYFCVLDFCFVLYCACLSGLHELNQINVASIRSCVRAIGILTTRERRVQNCVEFLSFLFFRILNSQRRSGIMRHSDTYNVTTKYVYY